MVSFSCRMDDSQIYMSLALASPQYFRCLYSITHLYLNLNVQWISETCCLVAKLCLTLFQSMDCRPPGSSVFGGLVVKSCLTLVTPWTVVCQGSFVHGILQARILKWVAISFSRGSSWPRDQTQVSSIAGNFFTDWATRDS